MLSNLALYARELVQVPRERKEFSRSTSMYKLPPLVTRPNRRMPLGINELLQLPAYGASRRREQVGGETRIQYPFSHGDLIEE
jgi:hypothetical protein